MKQTANRILLWAYLGPLFSFLASLLSLFYQRYEALFPLVISVISLPSAILWKKWGLLATGLLLSLYLFIAFPPWPLYQIFLSLLVMGGAVLAFLTLDKVYRPIYLAQKEGKKGWDRAEGLDAHLKEVQREHLKRVTAFKEKEAKSHVETCQMRTLLNQTRCEAYQQKLDLARLQKKQLSSASRSLMGELAQLRSQFQDKDRELASTRRERYRLETELLELERRFNEERLNSYEEIFWISPPEAQEEKEDLEALVGDLLSELKSRCVPSQSLDLSLLGK